VTTTPRLAREEVWRVTKEGRTLACELHSDERSGAGWEVVLKADGEWLFGRRCPDEGFARFVATGLRQDQQRAGWIDT
jgi:hypothetical protein